MFELNSLNGQLNQTLWNIYKYKSCGKLGSVSLIYLCPINSIWPIIIKIIWSHDAPVEMITYWKGAWISYGQLNQTHLGYLVVNWIKRSWYIYRHICRGHGELGYVSIVLSVYESSVSDKTVAQSSNLYNGDYYTWEAAFYTEITTLDLSSHFPGLPSMRFVTAWQHRSESPWWHTYQSPTQPQRLIHKVSTQPRNSAWNGKFLMNATSNIIIHSVL